jgi:hypothetical protein
MSELPQLCFGVDGSHNLISYICDGNLGDLSDDPLNKEINCRNQSDVWAISKGKTSKVGVEGKDVYRSDLRKSESIKNAFTIELTNNVTRYFSKVKVGLGSKHIYVPGDFMKEHYDTKLPDMDGLPHIMTMIVTDSIEQLKVCGQKVPVIKGYGSEYVKKYIVLFTLNCPHEVVTIEQGIRHSFVFPVYGHYRGVKLKSYKQTGNLFDKILEVIDRSDAYSSELLYLEGWLKSLENPTINSLIHRLIKANDEYYEEDCNTETYYEVTYTDEKGERKTCDGVGSFEVSFAKDLILNLTKGQTQMLKEIRSLVVKEKQSANEEYAQFMKLEVNPFLDTTEVPLHPFTVVLQGRYLPTATVKDLISQDLAIYNFLTKKRKVTFYPLSSVDIYEQGCVLELVKTGLTSELSKPRYGLTSITEEQVDFNDEGGYEPSFTRVRAMLSVN